MNREHKDRYFRTTRARAQLRAGRNDWYRIDARAPGARAVSISIYDEIGWFGVTAEDFCADLDRLVGVEEIELRLNSPGGSVFDGVTIYNRLKEHPAEVHVVVDGLAASIASVIAMAGDRVTMKPDALMMIHDASGFAIGQAADMRDMADLLDTASANMAKLYARETGRGTPEDWRAMMSPLDTRFTAEQAVEAGLAHDIDDGNDDVPVEAGSWDMATVLAADTQPVDLSSLVATLNPDPDTTPEPDPDPEPEVDPDVSFDDNTPPPTGFDRKAFLAGFTASTE